MEFKKTVLVVEDNVDARELLAIVIKRAGYDVIEAGTGLDAVDKAREFHPDLILMDIGLPGINGDEATERIKADASTRNIPVIVNTAYSNESSFVKRAIAAGAEEILFKPVNFAALKETVQRYLTRETHTQTAHNVFQAATI